MANTADVALADELKEDFINLENEISKKIIGQKEVVRLLITSLFCNGHSLLVGVPGLAKPFCPDRLPSAFHWTLIGFSLHLTSCRRTS